MPAPQTHITHRVDVQAPDGDLVYLTINDADYYFQVGSNTALLPIGSAPVVTDTENPNLDVRRHIATIDSNTDRTGRTGHPEPWPHEGPTRPITEALAEFDRGSRGQADIDLHSVLWELLHDVADSYSLAMTEQTTLNTEQIAAVNTTVADYVSNTYS